MVITNTGNLDTNYTLSRNMPSGITATLEVSEVFIPAHITAGVLVTVRGHQAGVYSFTRLAQTSGGAVADTANATLIIEGSAVPTVTPTGTRSAGTIRLGDLAI